MHAIRLHEFGPPDGLRYEEVDDPGPGAGQVRIAVRAAGVHLLDTTIRSGASGGPFPLPELPTIPGREVAGVVDLVGDAVDRSWLGARVVAHLGQASGGYAELAVAGVGSLHRLPDGVTDEAAVAMIGTGRTTMAILDVADLTADDVVLVTAAAGGIGSLLVQAAPQRRRDGRRRGRRSGQGRAGAGPGSGRRRRLPDRPDWADEVRTDARRIGRSRWRSTASAGRSAGRRSSCSGSAVGWCCTGSRRGSRPR